MAKIITLTGPSGAGKSTAIDFFLQGENQHFKPFSIPKYTTRKKRIGDKATEVICVERLPEDCDLVYQQYDDRYGVRSEEIFDLLEQGISPILVLNDIRTIQEIKSLFGKLSICLFLFRKEPNEADFLRIAQERENTDYVNIQKRLKKASSIYRIYIENIYLFDNVILNQGKLKDLKVQVNMLIKSFNPNYKKSIKLKTA